MRKNPTVLISAGKGEIGPTNPPPVTPPIAPPGGIKPVIPPIAPPGGIRPVTPPVILNPNPPGSSRGETGPGGFQIAPPTGGPKSVKDVLTPKQDQQENGEKKMNQLFIYGGIALALYLLFK